MYRIPYAIHDTLPLHLLQSAVSPCLVYGECAIAGIFQTYSGAAVNFQTREAFSERRAAASVIYYICSIIQGEDAQQGAAAKKVSKESRAEEEEEEVDTATADRVEGGGQSARGKVYREREREREAS